MFRELLVADAVPSVDADLVRVDDLLREYVGTANGFLAEAAAHIIGSDEYRLRSALTLCAAQASGGSISSAVTGGAACELVHLGMRYHADVIDEDEIRRGVPSANAHWSNCVAILAGDVLLARASSLAASLGAGVAALLAETINNCCRGQLLELQHLYDVDRTEEDYDSAIAGKTTALFATACRIGGMISQASDHTLDALSRFGHHLGVGFQIVDDTLDLSAAPARLRKPDRDLRDGVYTLPVIYAMRDSSELRTLLGGPLDDGQLERARRIVDASCANDVALDIARSHAVTATRALERADALDAGARVALMLFVEDLAMRSARSSSTLTGNLR
jgi:heptaprenyl diphosphate synthase